MSEHVGVSVVIPTYNRADLVIDAVGSALTQAWEPLEVIVVDDGSSDDTVARLEVLAAEDARLRVIARSRNGGKSVARNLGILAAKHPYVALLDSDNRFLKGKLEQQMPLLLGAPADAVCFSGYTLEEGGRQAVVVLNAWRAEASAALSALLSACCVNTSTFLAPRTVLIEAGLFRADLTHCEDHDLWLRLAITGHAFQYVPEPLSLYRLRSDSASADEARVARSSELVIGDFLARTDLPSELADQRDRWISHWALTSAERYLSAGRGPEALIALARAAVRRPAAIRPGWLRLALMALRLTAGEVARR